MRVPLRYVAAPANSQSNIRRGTDKVEDFRQLVLARLFKRQVTQFFGNFENNRILQGALVLFVEHGWLGSLAPPFLLEHG